MSRKCRGLLGWILGHKFHHATFEWVEYFPHCQRCGMPQGGWAAVPQEDT